MTEETKITIRQIINQIFDMLPDIEKEKAEWCEEHGIDRNKPRHISEFDSCLENRPAEQRLMSFLMGLKEEQVRKVLTLYFAGRDNEKDIYGQYYDSQLEFPSKECIVYRLLGTQLLEDSLSLGLSLVDEQNIDIEDSFDVNDEK